ncbi:MAG: hypothetical protein RR838_00725 [Clostridium sp.]
MFKRIGIVIMGILILSLIFAGSVVKAFVNIPDEFRTGVTKKISESFDWLYGDSKYNNGISESDISKGIDIGRGIPITRIVYENLGSTNNSMEDILDKYENTIYIFFPRVGGKVINPCQAAKNGATYSVDSVNVNPNLEELINYGIDLGNKNQLFSKEDATLVDFGGDVYGIYSKENKKIVMISSSLTLGYKKGDIVSFKDLHSMMMKVIGGSDQTIAANANQGESRFSPVALVGLSTLVTIGLIIAMLKCKRN